MAASTLLLSEMRRFSRDRSLQPSIARHRTAGVWSGVARLLVITGCASLCWMILAAPLLGLLPRD